MKTCSKCKESKELGEFYKNRSKQDGLSCYCKICARETQKRHMRSDKGRATREKYDQSDGRKEVLRKYNKTDSCKAARKRYSQSDKSKAVDKKYTQSTRGVETARKHKGSPAHRAVRKTAAHKRRARKLNQLCTCCNPNFVKDLDIPEGYHIDHIQPLSKGGLHCRRNIQIIPAEVNLRKGTKNIIYLSYEGQSSSAIIASEAAPERNPIAITAP